MYLNMNGVLDTTPAKLAHVTTDHKSKMYNFNVLTWEGFTRGRSGECLSINAAHRENAENSVTENITIFDVIRRQHKSSFHRKQSYSFVH
jgi:hypothetical protein